MSYGLTVADLVEIANLDKEHQRKGIKQRDGLDGIAKDLKTSLKKGLTSHEAESASRREAFGNNELPDPPSSSWMELFYEALTDQTMIILSIAAIVSLALGIFVPPPGEEATSWIEGAAILIAVLLVSTVGATINYKQEQEFKVLDKKEQHKEVLLIRDGNEVTVPIEDLRVGDVVILKTGDKIPADGLFVATHGADECRVDFSVMTGEPVHCLVDENRPVMLSGCTIGSGDSQMLVIATGVNSQWGILFSRLTQERDPTPLQEKLDRLAGLIGYGGAAAAIVVFSVLAGFWFYHEVTGYTTITKCIPLPSELGVDLPNICASYEIKNEWKWGKIRALVDFFIIAITIVVVAVPEGLPLAVTISLGFSMRKMIQDNCLVRRLQACETLGGATNICSDKTGTLTENRMTVMRGWISDHAFDDVKNVEINERSKWLLCNGICINSDAVVTEQSKVHGLKKVDSNETSRYEFIGNKTECALLVFAIKLGVKSYEEIRRKSRKKDVAMRKFSFTSARKRMSTVVRQTEDIDKDSFDTESGQFRLHCKGASETILGRCTHYITASGERQEIGADLRKELEKLIVKMAKQGLRTIALGFKDLEDETDFRATTTDDMDEESRKAVEEAFDPENDLTLVGLVGIEDKIRAEVPDAVSKCQLAGITVRMVTGDNLDTAKKIATDCNILTADGIALEGPVFRAKTDEEIDAILPRLQVLARSVPLDKERLVNRLRANREVVGVTGDGTNDVPAMRAAHVGLSMGIEGTDVAKQASDIVILDDNFRSIVVAVMWGRCVYDNIKKFLQFQLTVNIAALTIALVGALANRGTPLAAVQLLWVNLIMDTMAALALATEQPSDDLLNRKPYGMDSPVPISALMTRSILGQGIWQTAILLVLIFQGAEWLDLEDMSREHYTLVFNTFVWLQIFNEINARKVHNEWNVFEKMFSNYLFMGIMVITIVFQIGLVELAGEAAKVTHQSLDLWIIAIGLGATSLVIGALLHLIPADDVWAYLKTVSFVQWLSAVLSATLFGGGDDEEAGKAEPKTEVKKEVKREVKKEVKKEKKESSPKKGKKIVSEEESDESDEAELELELEEWKGKGKGKGKK